MDIIRIDNPYSQYPTIHAKFGGLLLKYVITVEYIPDGYKATICDEFDPDKVILRSCVSGKQYQPEANMEKRIIHNIVYDAIRMSCVTAAETSGRLGAFYEEFGKKLPSLAANPDVDYVQFEPYEIRWVYAEDRLVVYQNSVVIFEYNVQNILNRWTELAQNVLSDFLALSYLADSRE